MDNSSVSPQLLQGSDNINYSSCGVQVVPGIAPSPPHPLRRERQTPIGNLSFAPPSIENCLDVITAHTTPFFHVILLLMLASHVVGTAIPSWLLQWNSTTSTHISFGLFQFCNDSVCEAYTDYPKAILWTALLEGTAAALVPLLLLQLCLRGRCCGGDFFCVWFLIWAVLVDSGLLVILSYASDADLRFGYSLAFVMVPGVFGLLCAALNSISVCSSRHRDDPSDQDSASEADPETPLLRPHVSIRPERQTTVSNQGQGQSSDLHPQEDHREAPSPPPRESTLDQVSSSSGHAKYETHERCKDAISPLCGFTEVPEVRELTPSWQTPPSLDVGITALRGNDGTGSSAARGERLVPTPRGGEALDVDAATSPDPTRSASTESLAGSSTASFLGRGAECVWDQTDYHDSPCLPSAGNWLSPGGDVLGSTRPSPAPLHFSRVGNVSNVPTTVSTTILVEPLVGVLGAGECRRASASATDSSTDTVLSPLLVSVASALLTEKDM